MQLKPNTSAQPQPQYGPECVAVVKVYKTQGGYAVELDGKKVERLRSFEMKIEKDADPFIQIEQGLPWPSLKPREAPDYARTKEEAKERWL